MRLCGESRDWWLEGFTPPTKDGWVATVVTLAMATSMRRRATRLLGTLTTQLSVFSSRNISHISNGHVIQGGQVMSYGAPVLISNTVSSDGIVTTLYFTSAWNESNFPRKTSRSVSGIEDLEWNWDVIMNKTMLQYRTSWNSYSFENRWILSSDETSNQFIPRAALQFKVILYIDSCRKVATSAWLWMVIWAALLRVSPWMDGAWAWHLACTPSSTNNRQPR